MATFWGLFQKGGFFQDLGDFDKKSWVWRCPGREGLGFLYFRGFSRPKCVSKALRREGPPKGELSPRGLTQNKKSWVLGQNDPNPGLLVLRQPARG